MRMMYTGMVCKVKQKSHSLSFVAQSNQLIILYQSQLRHFHDFVFHSGCMLFRIIMVALFFNCSQTQFVAIILVLWSSLWVFFARPIFRLTHLTFRPHKRDKQVALGDHSISGLLAPLELLVSKYPIHENCFEETILVSGS